MSESNGTDDGIIHVMDEPLANKIAAGEVVQRPASVAKELIENALDAGASSIELILKDAGSTLVQVVDDGCGMSREDARRCFRRHATSKIRSVDDLESIRTLGFRGEALASIAAVAQVDLKTKRVEDAAGTHVRIEGGTETTVKPCAAPGGTSVAVRNLFYNVPARRNFLKTPATELKHLSETFQFLALSNPQVAFRMVHNGNEHYDLSAARSDDFFQATRQRIVGLLGEDHEDDLVPVEDASSDLTLRGFVGRPGVQSRGRSEQFLFVNDRYVRDRYLSHAVKKAYGDLLPEKTFPFFALFLRMDPRRVDVNVHPTKAEVKFDDQSGIYGFLRSAVHRALGAASLTPQFEDDREDGGFQPSGSSGPQSFQPKGGSGDGAGGSDDASGRTGSRNRSWSGSDGSQRTSGGSGGYSGGGRASGWTPSRSGSGGGSGGSSGRASDGGRSSRPSSQDGSGPAPGEQSEALYSPDDDRDRRPVWALHDTYLLTPDAEGLMLVDQRAAHVRVLYEKALARLQADRGESQQLLFPETVDLTAAEVERVNELMGDLGALGFDLEVLSGRTVSVRGVPVDVREGDATDLLKDMLAALDDPAGTAASDRREALAAKMARASAVRRGQPLSPAERRGLLKDLFDCEMPYADPSGTPTTVRMSLEEIEKRFG